MEPPGSLIIQNGSPLLLRNAQSSLQSRCKVFFLSRRMPPSGSCSCEVRRRAATTSFASSNFAALTVMRTRPDSASRGKFMFWSAPNAAIRRPAHRFTKASCSTFQATIEGSQRQANKKRIEACREWPSSPLLLFNVI